MPNSLKLDYAIISLKSVLFERIGTDYGGWKVPHKDLLDIERSICIGCGEDLSFDILLKTRFGIDVSSYDPTPKSIDYVRKNKIDNIIEFFPVGVWNRNCTLKFYLPRNPDDISLSIVNLQVTTDFIELKCLDILETVKDTKAEKLLLKMDIEGSEPNVTYRLLKSNFFPKILCIEFDSLVSRSTHTRLRGVALIKLIKKSGYRLITADGTNLVYKC